MNITTQYNKEVQDINRNLSTIKRGGASYPSILSRTKALKHKFKNMLADIQMKREKLASFKDEKMGKIEKVGLILKEQEEQIKKLDEMVEKYTNISKTVISSINFKKLAKVDKDESVEELFKFFYVTLYKENENTFRYNDFVNIALKKHNLDFQSRLARFSIAKLERNYREQIKAIKNNSYPTNNDDLNYLLEWIDYNFEAYLALKQKEDLEHKKQKFSESQKKYLKSLETSKYVSDEQQSIMSFLGDYIESLEIYERKIEKADVTYRGNYYLNNQKNDVKKIFEEIDRFEGNQLAEEIDNLNL